MTFLNLFSAMKGLVKDPVDLSVNAVAQAFALDLTPATVTQGIADSGFIIVDARRRSFPSKLGVVTILKPAPYLMLTLEGDERPLYSPALILGGAPQIQTAKRRAGFASFAFDDGVTIGCIVEQADTVTAIFCHSHERWP